jgi:large subunit ribosomal protein L22
MIIKAQQKNIPVTPKKMQLVANAVKHMRPVEAAQLLEAYNKKSASYLAKTIRQAMANATNNLNLPADSLKINQILMGRGMILKRFHAGARGRAKPYQKIRSHLTVLLESTPAKEPVVAAKKKIVEPLELPAETETLKTIKKTVTKKIITKKESASEAKTK